jgi:P-type Ca2+ transporter type 2C
MTFTTFVMFDMFNALACRHNNRPVFELSWNSNKAFLLAMAFSLLGQTAVLYFPPLQKVFRTVSLSFTDLIFVIFLTSSMLVLDTVRKEYFPSIFTEVLSSDSFRSDKGKVKTDDKSFMV